MKKKDRILAMDAYFHSKAWFIIAWHSYRLCNCMKDFPLEKISRKTVIPCNHVKKELEKSYKVFLDKMDKEYSDFETSKNGKKTN